MGRSAPRPIGRRAVARIDDAQLQEPTRHRRMRFTGHAPPPTDPTTARFLPSYAPVLAVLALALLVRAPGLLHAAQVDELYHVLAARSFLRDGTLSINGGEPYTRVKGFTLLIAGLFQLFGPSVAVARLPALVSGALVAALGFVWVRRSASPLAAWIVALLLCFSPDLIGLSQWSRFYAPQHLAVLAAAVGLYLANDPSTAARSRVLAGLGTAVAVWCAVYLQPVSVIAAGGLVVFQLMVFGVMARTHGMFRRYLGVLALAGILLAVFLLTAGRGLLDEAIGRATYVDAWAASSRNEIRFYHWWLIEEYPTLWSLFPVSLVLCVRRNWRLAVLCGSVFVVAFLVHSLLAWKALRYITYALPFFLIISGVAAAEVLPALLRFVRQMVGDLTPRRARAVSYTVVAVIAAFALLGNHATITSARMLARTDLAMYRPGPEMVPAAWGRAAKALAPMADTVGAVISGRDTNALYYLGRADFQVIRGKLVSGGPHREFWIEPTVQVPVISSPESIERVVGCYRSGMLIYESWQAETGVMIPRATVEQIRELMTPVDLPTSWGLDAFSWSGGDRADSMACREIRRAERPKLSSDSSRANVP